MTQSPLQHYQSLLESKSFQADANQALVVRELDKIYKHLKSRFQRKFLLPFYRKPEAVKGVYLWGGVGIGKTWLMDIFYQALPEGFALRMHFHQFMRQIHLTLKTLQGKKDPLTLIAKQFAKEHAVLYFDEFFVSDITDAMLLAGLLQALFKEGITLLTTSNVAPELLYKGGINRERFLPAIALLEKHTTILHLATKKDYRFNKLDFIQTYYYPLSEATMKKIHKHFAALAATPSSKGELLMIESRQIPTIRMSRYIVWFDFQVLCNIPRSQVDYLEIAKSFHTVFLTNVPQLTANNTNQVLYLINLVDIFYDANVKLIIAAACSMDSLYITGELTFQFQRTLSRLHEMQSLEYLCKPHIY